MVTSRRNVKITLLHTVSWELEGRKLEDFSRVQNPVNWCYTAVEESSHVFFSLAPLLRAIICTIRRFLTCKCSRCSDRGLHTVLNPSNLSLMCVSGLFSSALLCNNTSEPFDALGRICATFWFAQGTVLLPPPPPPLFLYLTYLHAPVALHVMQTVNTETLNRTKLCVNPKCAEYTSVWNKVYRERRWACYGRTEWRASVHNRSYLLPGRRAEEMLAGHLLTEDWLQEGQQITKEECCCSSADWPQELIRESICPQKQLCSGGAKSLFHCSHFSLKSRGAICKSWWCHFSSFGYNNPWERKMPKTQPVCFIPLSCTANHMASCPI